MLTLNFTSFPELHTQRVVLREYQPSDAIALFEMRANEGVARYIDREKPQTVADSEAMVGMIRAGFEELQKPVWAIALKENPTLMIGSIGFYGLDLANHRGEIGYMLSPAHWRKGIISECLERTIRFGFEDMKLHSIMAMINPGNEASRQILLKHGFVKVAYFREDHYFNGKFLDTEMYGLLKSEISGKLEA
ncbi:MAG: GNAT family protein [Pedobacter sp.]|nr:GNAT family protein [Pedobacter sp.]